MDMEFADEGGEGPTPYEVLLDAAMRGDATRFTRQDGVEEQWRIMQPLLDAPPPVQPYAKGSWGPEAGDALPPSRRLARPLGGVMTAVDGARAVPERAAERGGAVAVPADRVLRVPLELPHRGAGRARRRDRLAVRAAFDSPSVFATLLDRQAGYFRVGPFGINVPTARAYEPGTNTLVTTWHTPGGWIVVRDALTMGPRSGEDTVTPHTRPPADDDGDHMLVRTIECIDGSVEVELVCEPVFDYGRTTAEWTLVDDDRHAADASGAGLTLRLSTDMALGIEGGRARARHSCAPASRRTARSRGRRTSSPTSVEDAQARLRRPRASGAPGWTTPGSRTTACASRSSARR